jgi:dTDP-4-dehydrorhamnose reductase
VSKIVVLGSSGMLGKEVTRVLQGQDLDVVPTIRGTKTSGAQVHLDFDSKSDVFNKFFSKIGKTDYVVNCIGMIKQKFKPDNEVSHSIILNSILPTRLAACASEFDFRVIQIATDCVFSGQVGSYSESSIHDASDLYGVTKSLGEIDSDRYLNLRCSIIGAEARTNFSLYSWLLSQPLNSNINGYTDHYWNGLTTHSFARIVAGVISEGAFSSGTKHVVPSGVLTKYQLLKLVAHENGRQDLVINAHESGIKVDRSLTTEYENFNLNLWKTAGYEGKPTIEHMIEEFAEITKGARVEAQK